VNYQTMPFFPGLHHLPISMVYFTRRCVKYFELTPRSRFPLRGRYRNRPHGRHDSMTPAT
jgi:hypothetical protein